MIIYMPETLSLIEKERVDLVELLSGNLEQVVKGDVGETPLIYYKLIENEVEA